MKTPAIKKMMARLYTLSTGKYVDELDPLVEKMLNDPKDETRQIHTVR